MTQLNDKIIECLAKKPMTMNAIVKKFTTGKRNSAMYTESGVENAVQCLVRTRKITECDNKYYIRRDLI